uniref:Phosphatidate cytidylyltransferase n=1 Tax=Stygiella incarcerata TaxID=1712417 RepID=A0A192ZJ56_9EUKA|nr:CDP-DAG synthase [Stygiella incarcerata]|eukprot:TRINITY_DN2611_c0_g2_i1.p1 TRINITY_DN2611_c0_g2~~TRINITY_DN2611_c0_g2_i1.p1  ORF type:complete len:423 (-),score=98.98 TRINITY_DN2611_c0_g2_i1:139-1407(-)
MRRKVTQQIKDDTASDDADTSMDEDQEVVVSLQPQEEPKKSPPESKWKNFVVRTTFTCLMIGLFALIIAAGHVVTLFFIFLVQFFMFREVVTLSTKRGLDRRLAGFRRFTGLKALKWMNWWYLFATLFFFHGLFLMPQLRNIPYVGHFMKYHSFYSLMLYVLGFVMFVLSLQRGKLRGQFSQFAFTHMALLLIVVLSSALVRNVFHGMIWFLLPCSLIVINDICAYLFGFFMGRTPLIKLSPKKTWEGFIGGLFSTMVGAFFLARFLSMFDHMICPKNNLVMFERLSCPRPAVFIPQAYHVPSVISSLVPFLGPEVTIMPFQIHAMALGLFASIIAPFGGFFASGFKRAFDLKDFGSSIPGHGGITDRMDCQSLMGFFSWVYFINFVQESIVPLDEILEMVFSLSQNDKMELYNALQKHLEL